MNVNSSSVLSQSAFLMVNKKLAKKTSLHAAIMLADIISKREYFKEHNMIGKDGYFYNTIENTEKDTTLSKHQQQGAIKCLVDAGFLLIKFKGLPRKRHYKVNDKAVLDFLVLDESDSVPDKSANNSSNDGRKTVPLEGEKVVVNNNTVITQKKKNKINNTSRNSREDFSFSVESNGQGMYVSKLFGQT